MVIQLRSNNTFNKFGYEAQPRYRSVVFKSLGGSDDFLINGVTIAFLNSSGTTPSDSEQLTRLVIQGSKISIHSLTRNVGHGSNKQDLVGDFMIIILISS